MKKLALLVILVSHFTFANDYLLGVGVSNYRYEEDNMSLGGPNLRVGGTGIWHLVDKQFLRTEYNFEYSKLDYRSDVSGNLNNQSNRIHEIRTAWQTTVNRMNSFYGGIGYRNLLNDGRGTTTKGKIGYQRLSQYVFLPLGWITNFRLSRSWRWAINPEVAYMIWGQQNTYLGDISHGDPDAPNIRNTQSGGLNFRLQTPIAYQNFTAGPFLDYWSVGDSEPVRTGSTTWIEPRNSTLEIGLLAAYIF